MKIPGQLSAEINTVTLAAIILDGISPAGDAFARLGIRGGMGATALAIRVRAAKNISFREAHRRVGAALGGTIGADPVASAASALGITDVDLQCPNLLTSRLEYGGGPGLKAADRRRISGLAILRADEARLGEIIEHWHTATAILRREVDALISK